MLKVFSHHIQIAINSRISIIKVFDSEKRLVREEWFAWTYLPRNLSRLFANPSEINSHHTENIVDRLCTKTYRQLTECRFHRRFCFSSIRKKKAQAKAADILNTSTISGAQMKEENNSQQFPYTFIETCTARLTLRQWANGGGGTVEIESKGKEFNAIIIFFMKSFRVYMTGTTASRSNSSNRPDSYAHRDYQLIAIWRRPKQAGK